MTSKAQRRAASIRMERWTAERKLIRTACILCGLDCSVIDPSRKGTTKHDWEHCPHKSDIQVVASMAALRLI